MTHFFAILALLRWPGPEPATSLRRACVHVDIFYIDSDTVTDIGPIAQEYLTDVGHGQKHIGSPVVRNMGISFISIIRH